MRFDVPHFGLLVTKDDDEIIETWFDRNGHYFDEIVCLDGSRSASTRLAASRYSNVIYTHENQVRPTHKTDHGLRSIVHQLITDRHGYNGWITLCHADEFFYHDPRLCCSLADRAGLDGIAWYAVHFLPHPNDLARWPEIDRLPVPERFRYYHWDYGGSGQPWIEFRSYRNSGAMRWEPRRHGSTQPVGCSNVADFHPAYCHYKVFTFNPAWYEGDGVRTLFRHHWADAPQGRTGIPWPVRRQEDLFVSHYSPYQQCDYFSGSFNHPWNIGEEFR